MDTQQLLALEQEIQFESFSEETAWRLGSILVNDANSKSLPVAIDISVNGRQLFFHSLSGAPADLWYWIQRKIRLVNRVGHSSMYISCLLKEKNTTIEKELLIPESEFAPHGGCFPIIIRGTGVIGTVTVSGLPQEEDHELVVSGIRAYLALVL